MRADIDATLVNFGIYVSEKFVLKDVTGYSFFLTYEHKSCVLHLWCGRITIMFGGVLQVAVKRNIVAKMNCHLARTRTMSLV